MLQCHNENDALFRKRGYKYDEKAAVVNKKHKQKNLKPKTKKLAKKNNDCTTSEVVCCFITAALHGADLKQGVQRLKPHLMITFYGIAL